MISFARAAHYLHLGYRQRGVTFHESSALLYPWDMASINLLTARIVRIISPVFLMMLFPAAPVKAEITGEVVRIFDGDTLEVKDSRDNLYRIRLQGIDAPERGQAFSARARRTLSEMVFSKTVRVITDGVDTYGRHLGHVYLAGTWINREMVKRGMAWHYKYFSRDSRLSDSEHYARANHLGLWADPSPVPPWDYRREQKRRKSRFARETGFGFHRFKAFSGIDPLQHRSIFPRSQPMEKRVKRRPQLLTDKTFGDYFELSRIEIAGNQERGIQ